jgi:hypothetical protein
MVAYLISHLVLAGFNLINSRIDAYRIMRNKHIAHGINFGVYALFCTLLCWLSHWNVWVITLFSLSAFCNRQFSFDIPLNLRRGLKWDYVSTAKPPKAFLDRIEIRIFGYNGRAPVVVYAAIFLICFLIKILMLWPILK